MEIEVFYKDERNLCAFASVPLGTLLDAPSSGRIIPLEPQGEFFAELKYYNPVESRAPKLARQERLFKVKGERYDIPAFQGWVCGSESLLVIRQAVSCIILQAPRTRRASSRRWECVRGCVSFAGPTERRVPRTRPETLWEVRAYLFCLL